MVNSKQINLTKPTLGTEELQAVTDVLQSGWLIRGKQTKELEKEFAAFSGARYAVATNGCTMALYLVLKQLGLRPKDEVIIPSLTWSATAAVAVHAGATPVFADVKQDTWCLDPKDVERKITKHTKLIIPVHYAGRYAEGFSNFHVAVIFDSAHRIEQNDFAGITSCYSFYAVKNMTTVRGGMILTNDQPLADWYQKACHGGLTKDTLSRYQGFGSKDKGASSYYYEVEFPSWNFDMTDVEAAIGREQLKRVESLNRKRETIVNLYNSAFGLTNSGNHLYPLLVQNRDKFLIRMRNVGIQCGIHYLPLHLMYGYRDYYRETLPVTEFIGKHCVTLPLYPDLGAQEVEYIIEQAKKYGKFIRNELV